ncbi:MAG: aminotransferase class I/II-fold pyridoxal phosphate-dependent enzyme, partial [Planctomycetota bacterium]|nr:aminotransferase class I/II-fold pyridoxal phosphate-dependent enzyme [Planctomycetota bacterium]
AMAKLQGQMTTSIVNFIQPAIIEALTNGAESVERMRQTFAKRATLIHGLIEAMPGLICPRPTGAFYVFPDVSSHFGKTTPEGRLIDSALSFAEALLEEAKVGVVPGEDFGSMGVNHVRLSFACSEYDIEQGCERIKGWLETLK